MRRVRLQPNVAEIFMRRRHVHGSRTARFGDLINRSVRYVIIASIRIRFHINA